MKPSATRRASLGFTSVMAAIVLILATWFRRPASGDSTPDLVSTNRASPDPGLLGADAGPNLSEPEGLPQRLRWRLDCFQRKHDAVGFVVGVGKKFGQDQAGRLAALVAYFGFFSLFPLMLAFTSIVGFVVTDPDDQERFANEAADQIPVVGDTIRNTAGQLDGSTIAIVVGVALALWSGMKIVDAMQNALNTVWSVAPADRLNMVKRRLRGFAMLAVIGGGLIGSVVATNLASHLDVIPGLGRVAIWAASIAVSVAMYLLAFRLLTDTRKAWRDLWPGAVFGGLGWWGLQTFGSTFIANQQRGAGEAYGQFASIIALFAFLFLAAQLSILGAEINVVRARRLWPRSLTPGHLTTADVEAFELLANSTRQDDSYVVALRRPSAAVPAPERVRSVS